MQDILEVIKSIVENPFTQIAFTLIIAVIVQMIIRATIERIVHRVVHHHKYAYRVDEEKREHTLTNIFRTASAVVIWTAVLFISLWHLDVNVAALLTGAGVLGVIIGFGAQSTIRDILAGIFIITENQYRVGDIVTLRADSKDISGIVEDISIRITRLRDLDGNVHIVQNGESSIITNSSFGYANVNVDVGISYDSDVDKVEKVMNEVGHEMSKDTVWSPHIFEPIQFFRVDGFEDSAVRIKALGKVEPAMQWELAGEYRRRLKKAFEKNGIEIPFPQRVIHTVKR